MHIISNFINSHLFLLAVKMIMRLKNSIKRNSVFLRIFKLPYMILRLLIKKYYNLVYWNSKKIYDEKYDVF